MKTALQCSGLLRKEALPTEFFKAYAPLVGVKVVRKLWVGPEVDPVVVGVLRDSVKRSRIRFRHPTMVAMADLQGAHGQTQRTWVSGLRSRRMVLDNELLHDAHQLDSTLVHESAHANAKRGLARSQMLRLTGKDAMEEGRADAIAQRRLGTAWVPCGYDRAARQLAVLPDSALRSPERVAAYRHGRARAGSPIKGISKELTVKLSQINKYVETPTQQRRELVERKKTQGRLSEASAALGLATLAARAPQGVQVAARRLPKAAAVKPVARMIAAEPRATAASGVLAPLTIGTGALSTSLVQHVRDRPA